MRTKICQLKISSCHFYSSLTFHIHLIPIYNGIKNDSIKNDPQLNKKYSHNEKIKLESSKNKFRIIIFTHPPIIRSFYLSQIKNDPQLVQEISTQHDTGDRKCKDKNLQVNVGFERLATATIFSHPRLIFLVLTRITPQIPSPAPSHFP